MDSQLLNDLSLAPTTPRWQPGKPYDSASRHWQGIPGIEQTADGTLWATWYSGGNGEGPDNYVLLINSTDDGRSWSQPLVVIDPPQKVRAYDPCLWRDPLNRLWLFWAQSWNWYDGRAGVWAMRCDDPAASHPTWTDPKRLFHGAMMNKPVVLADGTWLAPAAVWEYKQPHWPQFASERKSNVYASLDQGRSWTLRGSADVPDRAFDEHMVIQKSDGSLWMLVRTKYGIGQSFSNDQGSTWTPGEDSGIAGPNTRFFIRRLASGRLLLVNHRHFTNRSHLTASLSDNDGRDWQHHLLLDERPNVSYPDAIESADGVIRVIYDRERNGAKEILMARVSEQDIIQGRVDSPLRQLKILVDRAGSEVDSDAGR